MAREVGHKSENFQCLKKKEKEYLIKLPRKLKTEKGYWNEQGGWVSNFLQAVCVR